MSIEISNDVISYLFDFFDLPTLSRAARVSVQWRRIANDRWNFRMIQAGILNDAKGKEDYLTRTGYFTFKPFARVQPVDLQGELADSNYGTTAIQIHDGFLWRGDESGNLECWELSTLSRKQRFRGI